MSQFYNSLLSIAALFCQTQESYLYHLSSSICYKVLTCSMFRNFCTPYSRKPLVKEKKSTSDLLEICDI